MRKKVFQTLLIGLSIALGSLTSTGVEGMRAERYEFVDREAQMMRREREAQERIMRRQAQGVWLTNEGNGPLGAIDLWYERVTKCDSGIFGAIGMAGMAALNDKRLQFLDWYRGRRAERARDTRDAEIRREFNLDPNYSGPLLSILRRRPEVYGTPPILNADNFTPIPYVPQPRLDAAATGPEATPSPTVICGTR